MPHRFPTVALCAALVLVAHRAHAIEDLYTPRAMAMGQSLRADATGALGPLLNPAGMPARRAYNIEAMYGFRVQDTGSSLLAAIADSITSRVSAGVYYSFVFGSPQLHLDGGPAVTARREGHETGLALALPLGDVFSFGLTNKYVRVTTDVGNPAYDARLAPDLPQRLILDSTISAAAAEGYTLDAGIHLRFGETFNLAVVGQNLVPLRSVEAPMQLAAGMALKAGTAFTLAADYVLYFDKYRGPAGENLITHRVGGGFEWLIAGRVALRGGSYWDQGHPGTWVTGGLAYVHQSFAIDAAYKQQVQGGVESYITAGLRVFLQ